MYMCITFDMQIITKRIADTYMYVPYSHVSSVLNMHVHVHLYALVYIVCGLLYYHTSLVFEFCFLLMTSLLLFVQAV